MNLKKQQLIAISLAFCCAAVMPLQAEARKKENKTNETQPVVSSYPIHTSSIYNKRLRSPRLLSPLKLSYSYCITAFRLPSYIYTAFRHDSVLLPECLPSTF